ncbi:hypothetical protein SEA_ABT2GRADUATEX2_35 [Streptomyces phage Abt2graduatex2]|nr:hypothetical protein SEA_ABT2GRADUATEX2_35 [Streptomyces phage Abt2graduatex2]
MKTDPKVPNPRPATPDSANGCTRPPHFPPHCGCPAG